MASVQLLKTQPCHASAQQSAPCIAPWDEASSPGSCPSQDLRRRPPEDGDMAGGMHLLKLAGRQGEASGVLDGWRALADEPEQRRVVLPPQEDD